MCREVHTAEATSVLGAGPERTGRTGAFWVPVPGPQRRLFGSHRLKEPAVGLLGPKHLLCWPAGWLAAEFRGTPLWESSWLCPRARSAG